MKLNNLFIEFMKDYLINKQKFVSKDSHSHNILVKEIPSLLKINLPKNYKITGRDGMGRSAEVPWIGIFDPKVTTTATKGIYLVFLFKEDMTGVYLSLMQGITTFEKNYKLNKYKAALMVSNKIRENISISEKIFTKEEIKLSAKKNPSWRVIGYEKANIVSKYYDEKTLSNSDIISDLNSFLLLYSEIVSQLNNQYDDFVESVVEEEYELYKDIGSTYDEVQKNIPHRNIPITYKEPTKTMIKGIEYFSREIKRKTDYISKVVRDHNVGLEGEAWVYRYEKDRLKKLGLEKYAKKVKWVSKESDSYGYDIKSFDVFENGLVEEVLIEVKTTTKNTDVEFYITRNEINLSNEKTNRYRLFRVYNASTSNPLFYIRSGRILDNFIVDPISFLARLKS